MIGKASLNMAPTLRAEVPEAALPQAPVTETVCRAAVAASTQLQARPRLPAADYLIAAAAAERGFGVLHEDRHFDLLATVLSFESVRLSRHRP